MPPISVPSSALTRIAARLVLVGLAGCLVACGGSSSHPSVARFAGSYSGSFKLPGFGGSGDAGTIAFTISATGEVAGTGTDSRYGVAGPVTGTLATGSRMTRDGQLTLIVDYPATETEPAAQTTNVGILKRKSDGTYQGLFTEAQTVGFIEHSYTLTRAE